MAASSTSAVATSWYDNAWIIGIVTGVASGAILALATPVFLSRRRAREIALKQERAAEDVLAALRPSVATGHFPSAEVVQAIVNASTYNRKLEPKYAVSASDLIDVLTAEVMASSFVSPEQRNDVANSLLSIKSGLGNVRTPPVQEAERRASDRIASIASAVTGACVIGVASAVSVLTRNLQIVFITCSVAVVILGIWQFGSRVFYIRVGKAELRLREKTPE
ncbi:MAG TPA: hypothetical protein VKU77_05955 [Streptosporangiaceae bacterium]|nr:hypothetical protein [Streptosporangiaceae bacterium]